MILKWKEEFMGLINKMISGGGQLAERLEPSFRFGGWNHMTLDFPGKESFLWLKSESPQSFICAVIYRMKMKNGRKTQLVQ